jgi:HEAT repeat protein
MSASRRLLPVLLFLLLPGTPARAQSEGQVNEDERILKAASVAVDGPGLLEFIRKQVPSPADEERLAALVKRLGDKTFKVREQAAAQLIAMGPPALTALRQVLAKADLETRRRAEQCIKAIEKRHAPETVAAAARLLKVRRPAGACAALLNYLPHAGEEISEELLEVVFTLGADGGKVDPALATALTDAAVRRRAAAALVLGRFGTPEQRKAVNRLLEDADPVIRLRAAQGLLSGGRKDPIPALIALLDKAPLPLARQAEDLLARVAGEKAPSTSVEEDAAARTKARQAWDDWWKTHKDRLDLSKTDLGSPFASPAYQARTLTQRFLEALRKGNLKVVLATVEVPFAVDAAAVFTTREQLDQLFQQAVGNVQQKKFTFTIRKVWSVDEYVRANGREPVEFLRQVPKANLRVVYVEGREEGGRVENAAVLVRVRGGRPAVMGIGVLQKGAIK